MIRTRHSLAATLVVMLAALVGYSDERSQKPNLVYILTDDQGYGDVSALNPDGKIPTPHIDRLAAEGMIFTDAHSSSSVCTPTRYQLLTGRYSWRTHLKSHVLNGYGGPLIAEDRLTLASLLRDHGYQTAMIGKWHLGMKLPVKGKTKMTITDKNGETRTRMVNDVDWSKPVKRTPTSNGFDYFWGHGASLDYPPYNYIENERYQSQTVFRFPEEKDPDCGWRRPGWIADNFDPFETLDEFCDRTAEYIRKHDGSAPFFVYVPLTSPHTPIIPTEAWKGKSGIGSYGDFVMQTDAGVGRILKALDDKGYADNTIVVFTSDNGCSKAANIGALQAKGHYPSYTYRGSKADIWEGGHRVPHIVRWPASIEAGSHADRLTVLGDIVATMADIVGADLPDHAAEDSVSFYPALLGKTDPGKEHEAIINHSLNGEFAVRTAQWKLIFAPGSAGWTAPRDEQARIQGLPEYQLYDMEKDPGEQHNLVEQKPEVVKQLTALARSIVVNGRSTPGEHQSNDTPNDWKQLHWMMPDAAGREPFLNNAGLPKVLIIGDSISHGYMAQVEKMLKGVAVVQHNPGNAQHTGTGMKKLDQWLGETEWDVIHFNWGLWDLCYRHPDSPVQGNRDKINGTLTTSLDQYEQNLDQLAARLRKTNATLIWAHTTLVPEGEAGRKLGDDKKYNEVASRIMKKHNIRINDLNSLTAGFAADLFKGPGDVHYSKEGYQEIGRRVANEIRSVLQ